MDYTRDLFRCIEDRNKELNNLLYGYEYNKGLQIKNIQRMLRSCAMQEFVEAIQYKLAGRKIQIKQQSKVDKKECTLPETFDSYFQFKDKKIVVYTCIVGKYDELKEPLLAFDNVKYICYTDNIKNVKTPEHTKWEIRSIPQNVLAENDNTLTNRYIKMHPQELFFDADYSIYVDGNIKFASFPGAYIPRTVAKTGIAIFAHSQRNCAYDEADVCILRKKGNKGFIKHQMQRYHEEGFPENYGLYECTIIATDLKNDTACQLYDAWWKEFVESQSLRDQLSLPFVMWKNGFQYMDIGLLGTNIFDDCRITVYSHK